jgi:hypothetical protein
MTAHELEVLRLSNSTPNNEKDDEYSIPLDISDIINICREYTKLTWQMQNQIEAILEMGVEEAIRNGAVNKGALPHIKNFLDKICKNVYFGDAIAQAQDCINIINLFLEKNSNNIMQN